MRDARRLGRRQIDGAFDSIAAEILPEGLIQAYLKLNGAALLRGERGMSRGRSEPWTAWTFDF